MTPDQLRRDIQYRVRQECGLSDCVICPRIMKLQGVLLALVDAFYAKPGSREYTKTRDEFYSLLAKAETT